VIFSKEVYVCGVEFVTGVRARATLATVVRAVPQPRGQVESGLNGHTNKGKGECI